ncbi:hypothetical protein [Candidatus Lucifugimonas marina]|jgi:hypothetical protein|uniref:Uncharacterized protein n=1 Tax=Candidatus Lucifugimonas marina TaxID=3038979 RepID=A0AAJ6CV77_9CHLR|nr:hypothetical protein [SAR202 cluster bacterium JH702]MDG0870428.1 hypothetical protein [SAR202 cluster bacterium JH639]WFG36020.1 hypothetical protein GKN94_10055 [SAR202 cluster bacterium JH545]WFG39964.1 hypothetical protein GKO48_10160 [SAR202 cluster bacterium JH1073]
MKLMRLVSRAQLLTISALLIAMTAVACGAGGGGDDGVTMGGTEDAPKRIRIVESDQIFTEDDLKGIGWKGQRDFILDYPEATVAKWGYLNTKEVGILIYASAEDAKNHGVTSAEGQTFRRESDGQAPDNDSIDRISCRDKAGASAVKAETGFGSKSFSASYLDPEIAESDDVEAQTRVCSNRFPTYNDYTVVGNIVAMCESDTRNLTDPSTNCEKIAGWLIPTE